MSPAIFPSGGSASRRPLPSAGSSEGEFPRFTGTMRRSDSRPPIPPRFVSFAWRYATKARSTGSPRFLGSPHVYVPGATTPDVGPALMRRALFNDPGGPATLDQYSAPMLPSASPKASAPTRLISGLNHTARTLAVYPKGRALRGASQDGSPRHHARLASGCWSALPDGSGYPLDSYTKGFSLHGILLPQALPGARAIQFSAYGTYLPRRPDAKRRTNVGR